MRPNENSPRRVRVNISVPEEIRQRLQEQALKRGSNVSQVITDCVRELFPEQSDDLCRNKSLALSPDTFFHLESWADEHHTTPEQAVTDWIWKQKVKDQQIRGQMCLF